MHLLNGRWPVRGIVLEERVKRIKLVGTRRLANCVAEIEHEASAAQDTFSRPKSVKRDPCARRGLYPEQRIMLKVASQRVEQPALEVSVHSRAVVVIRAMDRSSVALIFVSKTDLRCQMRRDRVFTLVYKCIAIRKQLVPLRIVARKIHQRAP